MSARRVYVLQDGEFCKVGCSSNPQARARNLQSGNPRPLTLVFESSVVGDSLNAFTERRAHVILERLSVGSEWFRATPEVAAMAVLDALGWAAENFELLRSGKLSLPRTPFRVDGLRGACNDRPALKVDDLFKMELSRQADQ